jgi:hypothetical protein
MLNQTLLECDLLLKDNVSAKYFICRVNMPLYRWV